VSMLSFAASAELQIKLRVAPATPAQATPATVCFRSERRERASANGLQAKHMDWSLP
jgi:hypothetical protein